MFACSTSGLHLVLFESAVELAGLTFAANPSTTTGHVIGYSFNGGGVFLTDPDGEHPPCLTATPTLGPTTPPSTEAPTEPGDTFAPTDAPATGVPTQMPTPSPSDAPTPAPMDTPATSGPTGAPSVPAGPSSRPTEASTTTAPTRSGETFSPSPFPTHLAPTALPIAPPTAAPALSDGDMEITLTIVDKDLSAMSTAQRDGLKAQIVDRYCTMSFSAVRNKAPCVTDTTVGLSPGSIVATVVATRSTETLAGAQAMVSAANGNGLVFTVEGTLYAVGTVAIYSVTAGLTRSPTLATAAGQMAGSGSNQSDGGTSSATIAIMVLALIGLLFLLTYMVYRCQRKKAGARGNAISPQPVASELGSATGLHALDQLANALRSAKSGSKNRVVPAEDHPSTLPMLLPAFGGSLVDRADSNSELPILAQHVRRETIPFQSSAAEHPAAPKALPGAVTLPGVVAPNSTVVFINNGGSTVVEAETTTMKENLVEPLSTSSSFQQRSTVLPRRDSNVLFHDHEPPLSFSSPATKPTFSALFPRSLSFPPTFPMTKYPSLD